MAWLAVHPGLTEKLRIPDETGPEFELQFWPPREAARFEIASQRISREILGLDLVKDFERLLEVKSLDHRVITNMVRFGVMGWTPEDGGLPCSTEEVEIDGRKHTVITHDSVELLRVNRLLVAVAIKTGLYNRLTPEQKKTSSWRLPSSGGNPGTSAGSAAPSSPTGPSGEESSSSTGTPSTAVPTG